MEYIIIYHKILNFFIIDANNYFNLNIENKEKYVKDLLSNFIKIKFDIYPREIINVNILTNYHISNLIRQKYDLSGEYIDFFIFLTRRYSNLNEFPIEDIDHYQPHDGWLHSLYDKSIINYLGTNSKRKLRYVKLLESYVYVCVNYDKLPAIDIYNSPIYHILELFNILNTLFV